MDHEYTDETPDDNIFGENMHSEKMFPDDQSKMWSSLCGESDFNMDPSVGLDSLFSELFSSMYPTNTKPMDCNVIEEQSFNSEPSALPVLHSTYIKESFLSTMSTMSESPISSDSGIHQHRLSTVPRYKRPSHKRAELKRRDKIKDLLVDLKAEVPVIADNRKLSKITILSSAAEYLKYLKGDCERYKSEAAYLQQEIESLNTEIHTLQNILPDDGLQKRQVKVVDDMDQRFIRYIVKSTLDDWKFYILMKPTFESFKITVKTDNVDTFKDSVVNWSKQMLNLSRLRLQTCERLRDMSQTTCIMTNPELLQKEALENICYIDTCGDKSRDYLVSVPVSDLRNVRAIESSVYTASPHRQSNILDRNGVIFKSMLDQKMDVDDHDGGNSLSVFSTCSMLDKFPSHIPSISVFNPAVRPTMQSVDFSSNITSTEILPLSNSSSVIYMPSTLSMNRCSQSYSSMLSSEGGPSLTCSIFSESPAINYECSDSKITTCPDSNGKITLTTVADHVVSSMSSVDVIGLSDAHHVYDFDLIDIPLPELDKEETVY